MARECPQGGIRTRTFVVPDEDACDVCGSTADHESERVVAPGRSSRMITLHICPDCGDVKATSV